MSILSPVRETPPTLPAFSKTARTLAISLEIDENHLLNQTQMLSDVLLRFSPRLVSRVELANMKPANAAGLNSTLSTKIWFFLDLSSHSNWIERTFGDEVRLVEAVLKTLGSLDRSARIAIADTPQAAQAFAVLHGYWISAPGRTRHDLERLPLSALIHLEGLEAWSHPSRIESMASFFALLGFHTIGNLKDFNESSFQERWGEIGTKVYRRLQAEASLDPQPISPFVATDPLKSFVHLDYPISIMSLLIHEVEMAMKALFARLEGRRLVVKRMKVCLRCEYSDHEHIFSIEPSVPTREIRFFRLLLENRLDRVELLNPIKDLQIDIDPVPENERQDAFENQASLDQNKLSMLTSLLAQEGAQGGFAILQDDVWPENTWIRNPTTATSPHAVQKYISSTTCGAASGAVSNVTVQPGDLDETGYAPKFHYAAALEEAPRPALLLRKPRPLETAELSSLHFYTNHPIERIEHSWWEGRAGPPGTASPGERRDYYIARDSHGRSLWLYKHNETFFLHGAFD